jgi:Raf kinase inhibitor-like YbhB/YbcL family protein
MNRFSLGAVKASSLAASLTFGAILVGASLALGDPALAAVRAGDISVLAMDRILSAAVQPMTVNLPAVPPGEPIPDVNTAFGKNISPAVAWEGAPPGVRSYVLIVEDSDGHGETPVLHWLAYNIPATVTALSKDVRNRAEPKAPFGMMQGMNHAGGVGYIGPKPPQGDPPHHYHFEVFALDRVLKLKPKQSLEQVIAAMNDRVMAEGEAVATFAAPPPDPPGDKPSAE